MMLALALLGGLALVTLVAGLITWGLLRSQLNPFVQERRDIMGAVKQVPGLVARAATVQAQLAQLHDDVRDLHAATVDAGEKQRREIIGVVAELRQVVEEMRRENAEHRGAAATRLEYLERGMVSVAMRGSGVS